MMRPERHQLACCAGTRQDRGRKTRGDKRTGLVRLCQGKKTGQGEKNGTARQVAWLRIWAAMGEDEETAWSCCRQSGHLWMAVTGQGSYHCDEGEQAWVFTGS